MANKKDISIRSSAGEYLSYIASTGSGDVDLEVLYSDETIWMTQKMMATMYDAAVPTVNEHIHHIYADHELEESATVRNFRIVRHEGNRDVNRNITHYSLPVIITTSHGPHHVERCS